MPSNMKPQDVEYKIIPLDELQWWSIEVISNTILGVGVGIMLGFSDLGVWVTVLFAGSGLLTIVFLSALLRQANNTSTILINAPIEQVYDAMLTASVLLPLLRSLWGSVLRVDGFPALLQPGKTINAKYELNGKTGTLILTVPAVERPHHMTQEVHNRFRGRVTRGTNRTILEATLQGTRVTQSTHMIFPIGASHLMGAVYSRMVVSRTTKNFLGFLKQTAEAS